MRIEHSAPEVFNPVHIILESKEEAQYFREFCMMVHHMYGQWKPIYMKTSWNSSKAYELQAEVWKQLESYSEWE